jgi:hypothetical protein
LSFTPGLLSAGGEEVELKHIRVSSIVLRWALAVSLTASPLLAEFPPQSDVLVQAHRPAVRVVDENNNPLVGNSIYTALVDDSPAASGGQAETQKIETQKTGKELGKPAPRGNPDNGKAEPGGKTLQTLIIAALIAGGVVALILLLGDSDHKKPGAAVTTPPTTHGTTPPPQEGGTILVPGTPTVSSPR